MKGRESQVRKAVPICTVVFLVLFYMHVFGLLDFMNETTEVLDPARLAKAGQKEPYFVWTRPLLHSVHYYISLVLPGILIVANGYLLTRDKKS